MSKVYDIGLQRYRDCEIIVCGKDSTPLIKISPRVLELISDIKISPLNPMRPRAVSGFKIKGWGPSL